MWCTPEDDTAALKEETQEDVHQDSPAQEKCVQTPTHTAPSPAPSTYDMLRSVTYCP
eukprot:m.101824 g.101824  ORF g.101824 m.101824 type:complete len:57 (-) comp16817_c0_seq9:1801-1971(-)